jgi:cytochrome bd-type quinol oxidase subunit 2
MNTPHTPGTTEAWALIEREKRRDRFIKRVSVIAWSVTGAVVLIFAILVGAQMIEFARAAAAGELPWATVWAMSIPLLWVIGLLSVLVATLSTIAIFLRLRTSSLSEIQLRLAALEDILSADSGRPKPPRD